MSESDGRKDEGGLEIAASEARDRFGELIDRALSGERITITRNGRRIAALVSVRDADRLAPAREPIQQVA
jgi:prevent-host-death family protein